MNEEEEPGSDKIKTILKKSKLVLVLLVMLGLAVVIWLAWFKPGGTRTHINSFQDCVDAGHPVQEKYPPACATPDGRTFTDTSLPPVTSDDTINE